jgi:hypothetical protein
MCEPAQTLHGGKVNQVVLKDFVRWRRRKQQSALCGMAVDGCAAESFENAHLDFVRFKCEETIESGRDAVEVLAGQSDDEIGVDGCFGVVAEEPEVVFDFGVFLVAMDSGGDIGVESLYSDFEVQSAFGEFLDAAAHRFREPVGDHLEVQEKVWRESFKEEIKNSAAGVKVDIEAAIDELEPAGSPIEQAVELDERFVQRESADSRPER